MPISDHYFAVGDADFVKPSTVSAWRCSGCLRSLSLVAGVCRGLSKYFPSEHKHNKHPPAICSSDVFVQIEHLPVTMCLLYMIVTVLWTLMTRVQTLNIAVSTQESHSSYVPRDDQFTSLGEITVKEESSFFIKCVSDNHYSSNSSLVWNVNTKVGGRK